MLSKQMIALNSPQHAYFLCPWQWFADNSVSSLFTVNITFQLEHDMGWKTIQNEVVFYLCFPRKESTKWVKNDKSCLGLYLTSCLRVCFWGAQIKTINILFSILWTIHVSKGAWIQGTSELLTAPYWIIFIYILCLFCLYRINIYVFSFF